MSGNGLKIALAASLAANLFIVGAVVGAVGMRARLQAGQANPAPAGNPLLRAGDDLPPNIRQAYRAQLRQATAASRQDLEAARQARAEVARILAQPDFDPAAARQALAKAREAELAARAQVEEALIGFVETAGPVQRRVIARGLAQEPANPGQGRGAGPPGPPPPPPIE